MQSRCEASGERCACLFTTVLACINAFTIIYGISLMCECVRVFVCLWLCMFCQVWWCTACVCVGVCVCVCVWSFEQWTCDHHKYACTCYTHNICISETHLSLSRYTASCIWTTQTNASTAYEASCIHGDMNFFIKSKHEPSIWRKYFHKTTCDFDSQSLIELDTAAAQTHPSW